MRIALTTVGTTGDLQPFIALGLRLMARGHNVRIVSHPLYKTRVESMGIEFRASAPDISPELLNTVVERMIKTVSPIKVAKQALEDFLLLDAPVRFADCMRALEGCDLVVCHHADFAGQEAATRHGIRWANVILCPELVPTAKLAPFPFARLSFGETLNRTLWRLGNKALGEAIRPTVEKLRAAAGRPAGEPVAFQVFSPDLNLVATSRNVIPIEDDFPQDFPLTGPWFLDESATFEPGAELRDFLAAGPAPVVVSFGSMGAGDGPKVAAIVVEAIKRSGQRAIVQKGWGGVETSNDGQFHSVGYVPHAFLFGVGSCVIHHGGAGTTAAACRAGRPQIIVPHISDQFVWARGIKELGLGPRMLPRWFLNPARLAKRIREVVGNPAYARRAEEVGALVRAEDGLGVAVAAIEELATRVKGASAPVRFPA